MDLVEPEVYHVARRDLYDVFGHNLHGLDLLHAVLVGLVGWGGGGGQWGRHW